MFTISISEIYFKTLRLSHGIFLIRSLTSPRFSYIYIYIIQSRSVDSRADIKTKDWWEIWYERGYVMIFLSCTTLAQENISGNYNVVQITESPWKGCDIYVQETCDIKKKYKPTKPISKRCIIDFNIYITWQNMCCLIQVFLPSWDTQCFVLPIDF